MKLKNFDPKIFARIREDMEKEEIEKRKKVEAEHLEELEKIAIDPIKLAKWMQDIESHVNGIDNRTIMHQRIG